jgi:DNA primase
VDSTEEEKKLEEDDEAPPGPPDSFHALADDTSIYFEGARAYLRDKRKISEEAIRHYQIGACSRGTFAGRVVVPIFNTDGEWVWHVGRCWGKVERTPYLYPSGSREGLLFNHAALLKRTDDPLLGVEGVFDAIALGTDSSALLGKPTRVLREVLAIALRPIAMVLDGDALDDGLATALHLRLMGKKAGCVWLPPKTDPDELPRKEVLKAARACVLQSSPVVM